MGEAEAGDALERIELGHENWDIARASSVLHAGRGWPEEYAALAAMEVLSVRERERARSRLK